MIGWEDVYKVVVAMAPLYVALMMGYGSVRWWRIFITPEQCDAVNRLVCYFTLPLFTFEFTAHVDPFEWNLLFIGADMISKLVIVVVLAFWAKFITRSKEEAGGSYFDWSITSFSLCTLTNSLVVGVPLIKAMYGPTGVELVVQSSVVQAIVWLTILLFVLEFRRAAAGTTGIIMQQQHRHHDHDQHELNNNNIIIITSSDDHHPADDSSTPPKASGGASYEDGDMLNHELQEAAGGRIVDHENSTDGAVIMSRRRPSFLCLLRVVWLKLAMNPNSYACIVGIAWAIISNRWHFKMPSIMEGCVTIMSRAGTGTAMFSMGMFMASQEKLVACGTSMTVLGMVLRFIAGPAALAIGAIAMGLHGDVLRVAIIQAALPQSITSFIYAKEYGLHAGILSTAVIFGMMVSLPVLIAYYAILEFVH